MIHFEAGCGIDADLALVSLGERHTLQSGNLQYGHKVSPYVGRVFRGTVVRTVVRGRTVFREGRIASEPFGRLIRPKAGKSRAKV